MNFARPQYLFLLMLIPFWIVFFVFVLRIKKKNLIRFIPNTLWERVMPFWSRRKDGLRVLIFGGIFSLLSCYHNF